MRNEIQVKFAKLDAAAQLPTQGSAQAAGWDLYALEETIVPKGASVMIPTGISMRDSRRMGGSDTMPILAWKERHDSSKRCWNHRFGLSW